MQYKITYFILTLLFIISGTFLISSCGSDTITNTPPSDPVDTSDFQFPITVGNRWNYSYNLSAENIRPDSIRHYFSSYPVSGYGYNEILYDTNDPLGGTVRVFFDKLIISDDTTESRYYYTQNEYSMVCYGYRGGGTPSFPFKKQLLNNYNSNNMLFCSFGNYSGLLDYRRDFLSSSDTFIRFSPIVIVIKYPILRNTQWSFIDFGNYTITKKYVSWENYRLDSSLIPCIKTQRIWSSNNDFILYDYYSKYGQMKRDYLYKNTQFKNQLGITIGYYDKREVYNVISYTLSD